MPDSAVDPGLRYRPHSGSHAAQAPARDQAQPVPMDAY